ncbi:MAG: hypothetical protein ACXVJ5_08080 [Flavisolibacter sp.]
MGQIKYVTTNFDKANEKARRAAEGGEYGRHGYENFTLYPNILFY